MVFEQQEIEAKMTKEKIPVELYQSAGGARGQFTQLQNTYLNNSLRFADTKAGALVAVNGLVVKFVFDLLAKVDGGVFWLGICSIVLLVCSIVCSVITVFPKRVDRNGTGFIYWDFIAKHSLDQYKEQILEKPEKELLEESVRNNYFQAQVLTKKFRWLHSAFTFAICSYVVLALAGIIVLVN